MILTGRSVILRPITSDDTDKILRWRNSEIVRSQFLYRENLTREVHENWLKTMVACGRVEQFIIGLKDSGREIGTVYLRDIDYPNKKCEYGIYIGETDVQGCGYGSEATDLICMYAFQVLNLHKVFLRVLVSNARAIRCYLRAGFRKEGISRDHVWIDGTPCSVLFMAKLEEEKI